MANKMFVIRRENDEFDRDLVKFKPARKVQGINNSFYFQSLCYGDDGLYLQVPSFNSTGMSVSQYSNMRQMRVTFPKWQQNILRTIDEVAQEHVQCPDSAPSHWSKALEEGKAYKTIPEYDSLFLKLSEYFQAFDPFMNLRDCDELKRGKYIALIHVTGIYLGAHGTTGKLASLQMKVIQLIHEPMPIDKCLILFDANDFKDQDSDEIDGNSKGTVQCDDGNSKGTMQCDDGKKSTKRIVTEEPIEKPKLRRQEAQTNLLNHFNPFISDNTQKK